VLLSDNVLVDFNFSGDAGPLLHVYGFFAQRNADYFAILEHLITGVNRAIHRVAGHSYFFVMQFNRDANLLLLNMLVNSDFTSLLGLLVGGQAFLNYRHANGVGVGCLSGAGVGVVGVPGCGRRALAVIGSRSGLSGPSGCSCASGCRAGLNVLGAVLAKDLLGLVKARRARLNCYQDTAVVEALLIKIGFVLRNTEADQSASNSACASADNRAGRSATSNCAKGGDQRTSGQNRADTRDRQSAQANKQTTQSAKYATCGSADASSLARLGAGFFGQVRSALLVLHQNTNIITIETRITQILDRALRVLTVVKYTDNSIALIRVSSH